MEDALVTDVWPEICHLFNIEGKLRVIEICKTAICDNFPIFIQVLRNSTSWPLPSLLTPTLASSSEQILTSLTTNKFIHIRIDVRQIRSTAEIYTSCSRLPLRTNFSLLITENTRRSFRSSRLSIFFTSKSVMSSNSRRSGSLMYSWSKLPSSSSPRSSATLILKLTHFPASKLTSTKLITRKQQKHLLKWQATF